MKPISDVEILAKNLNCTVVSRNCLYSSLEQKFHCNKAHIFKKHSHISTKFHMLHEWKIEYSSMIEGVFKYD